MRLNKVLTFALSFFLAIAGMQNAYSQAKGSGQSEKAKVIRGTVIDDQDEPIVGATVTIPAQKGSGVLTDIDGKFSISALKETVQIRVSFMGYKTQEVREIGRAHV